MKTPLTIVALLSALSSSALAQSPGQAGLKTASNTAVQASSLIKPREFALNAELTVGTLGAGAEASLDLGYIGIAAGVAAGSPDLNDNGERLFLGATERAYIMARVQTPGIIAGYIGVGGATATTSHVDTVHFGDWNPGDKISYTEKSSNVMAEVGAKVQFGYFSGRAYVGLDTELDTNCIESEGDCNHAPIYGGVAFGIALH
jgi:hypothetical protein